MMATTFGHNFNFAAAKQNGEAFQQFPSHGLSLCLPLHLSHSLCPWARSENFHFLKLSANVFYTFPQTPSENAAWPRISMRMHTPHGDKVGRNVIISAGSAARGRGRGTRKRVRRERNALKRQRRQGWRLGAVDGYQQQRQRRATPEKG